MSIIDINVSSLKTLAKLINNHTVQREQSIKKNPKLQN